MKLTQLLAATTIADKGSLRAAARHLGMSQPALTHSLGELERELGATLFERRARGMALTPVGELFVRRARVIGSETQRAQQEVAQFLGGGQGSVTVCLSVGAHCTLLPTALPLFQERFPGIRLRIIEGAFPAAEARLRDGSMDFYVGPMPATASREFLVEKVFDNTRAVFARLGHPLAGARSLSELIHESWITTGITDKAEAEFAEIFATHKLPAPKLVIQAESMLTLATSLMSTNALAITLREYGEFPLTQGTLQTINIKEKLVAPPIVIVRRTALPLTPAAECFCDMLRRAGGHYAAKMASKK